MLTFVSIDIYHIGLPLQCTQEKQVIVQISAINSRELQLLHLNHLILAMRNDPDLANVDATILPSVLQTLFVTTGCDYTSFFSGIGKATFLRYFFQYASFITGNDSNIKGTLADTALKMQTCSQGFLAFLRLIGTTYFKKHASGFDTNSPVSHFNKFSESSHDQLQQHSAWLNDIRQNIWDRITFENEIIPSTDALWRHWKRSCWIIDMWRQADKNNMVLQPLNSHGWTIDDGHLTIDWDSMENIKAIQDRVSLLTKGCKCKTGCTTARCGCKKKRMNCSAGCMCTNCSNLPENEEVQSLCSQQDTAIAEIAVQEMAMADTRQLPEADDLLDWVFGEAECTDTDIDSTHTTITSDDDEI